jgi:hypothetical protein
MITDNASRKWWERELCELFLELVGSSVYMIPKLVTNIMLNHNVSTVFLPP